MKKLLFITITLIYLLSPTVFSQIVLLGDNAPFENVNDGDFAEVWSTWRNGKQSPFWTTKVVKGANEKNLGLHLGSLYSMCEIGVAESKKLNTNPNYTKPKIGDIINWEFGADLEYISNGSISLSLVFGKHERILAEKVPLKGSDKIVEHFKGTYVINKKDAQAGLPFVRATFYTSRGVKVYLDYVNISVQSGSKEIPELKAEKLENYVQLSWSGFKKEANATFNIYRLRPSERKKTYVKIGETTTNTFLDKTLINGIEYTYIVTQLINKKVQHKSNKVKAIIKDTNAPSPPTGLTIQIFDTEIKINWNKNKENDIASYSVYRGDEKGAHLQQIAYGTRKNNFLDFTPVKDTQNTYVVYAHDYSGNKSLASAPIKGAVKMIKGSSFSDLISPMPVRKKLSTNLWGAKGVLPRDPDNGIESKDWSYWGGRPVKDKDGKYHMCVTRWPANDTKGHWEWPHSTVAHAVSSDPIGPYKVKKDIAYSYKNGLGHNPDIILCNDGTYILYSLIKWKPMLFASKTMNGPWELLGELKVNTKGLKDKPSTFYRFSRNLSGVQLADERFLFVTKAGAMMISTDKNPLGPYNVVSDHIRYNPIIPKKYRNSNYEDPVLWKDEVQFHMMINAFLDYRAIYLRSSDGIHWKFNSGTAYTPNDTSYEDGTKTHWYKLERPHVLTDQYGRATHLSLATIDVPKKEDLARDNHSSKNLILPLVVHKRLKMLNKKAINATTAKIRIKIISEPGFNAHTDININSLLFGATEEVDYGRGCRVLSTKKEGKDLIVEFDGTGNGITETNFVAKLLGKTTKGNLIIGYTKLLAD